MDEEGAGLALPDEDLTEDDLNDLFDEDEDDVPEGACAFVVDRATELATPRGCATVSRSSGTALLALFTLLGIAMRRRRE